MQKVATLIALLTMASAVIAASRLRLAQSRTPSAQRPRLLRSHTNETRN